MWILFYIIFDMQACMAHIEWYTVVRIWSSYLKGKKYFDLIYLEAQTEQNIQFVVIYITNFFLWNSDGL